MTPTNEAGHGLPELPEWAKRDDLGGLVPSQIRSELRAYARAALALSRGVPADMVLVPMEPTEAMLDAADTAGDWGYDSLGGRFDNGNGDEIWAAMIKAAPTAAGAQGEVPNVADVLMKTDDPIQQMRMVVQVARENDSLISRKWVEGWADQWERERRLTTPQPAAADGAQGEEYPECSGDPSACPENEGHGCCKPNPKCSCPSGDGSLRWPCAVHQPAAYDVGVRERAWDMLFAQYLRSGMSEEKAGHLTAHVRDTQPECLRAIEAALSSHRQAGDDLSKFRELAERWLAEDARRHSAPTELSGCADDLIALVEKGAGS